MSPPASTRIAPPSVGKLKTKVEPATGIGAIGCPLDPKGLMPAVYTSGVAPPPAPGEENTMFPEAAKSISPVPVRTILSGSNVRPAPLPVASASGSGLDESAPATKRNDEDGI